MVASRFVVSTMKETYDIVPEPLGPVCVPTTCDTSYGIALGAPANVKENFLKKVGNAPCGGKPLGVPAVIPVVTLIVLPPKRNEPRLGFSVVVAGSSAAEIKYVS